MRARVQVARLLDVLTTESHVLEAQLERQLEAQLAALAGVHARSSSRLQENSPPPPRTNTSNTNGVSTLTSPAFAAAPSPHPSNNGNEHGGLGGADVGETHQNLSLREKVEMREAAPRAEAAAAAIGTVLNGDNKLVSLLQEWATLRDSRAALRRAVVVEDGYPDEAGNVRESFGSSRRRSGMLEIAGLFCLYTRSLSNCLGVFESSGSSRCRPGMLGIVGLVCLYTRSLLALVRTSVCLE